MTTHLILILLQIKIPLPPLQLSPCLCIIISVAIKNSTSIIPKLCKIFPWHFNAKLLNVKCLICNFRWQVTNRGIIYLDKISKIFGNKIILSQPTNVSPNARIWRTRFINQRDTLCYVPGWLISTWRVCGSRAARMMIRTRATRRLFSQEVGNSRATAAVRYYNSDDWRRGRDSKRTREPEQITLFLLARYHETSNILAVFLPRDRVVLTSRVGI